jgi:2-iminobutanoate/2-iminopropanoate deaminase
LFTSGQVAIDPATGTLIDGDIVAQTERVLLNVEAVLEAAGGRLSDIVKTTVFLADMAEFQAMNGVYARFFASAPPARSTVQVAALPLGARVEIEAFAVLHNL